MTSSTISTTRVRRATAWAAALVAAGTVLAAAGPASAQPKDTPGKKGCEVQLKGPGAGQSIVYEDGYSFSVIDGSTGKKHTYTCNDGKWTETVSISRAPGGISAVVTGTFQILPAGRARLDTSAVPAVSIGLTP
jgi:hypothetical protein